MNNLQEVFDKTIKMLIDRNYILPKNLRQLDMDDLINKYDGTIFVKKIIEHDKLLCKRVMIFFSVEKFGIKELRIKVQKIKEAAVDHVIFILHHKFTSHGQRLLNEYIRLHEEIFLFDTMLIDPIHHKLVPKHELLTPEETAKFYTKKIACIKINDPACRHYDGRIGQIFRIYRPEEIVYRIVTK